MRHISKEKTWDYFILTARFLLAVTFLSYGYSKLSNGQFGISETELQTPVKDLSLFKLSWYLFDHQPFKFFIGISQIICGILLMINQTVLLGAFLFLPIVSTILIIDLTYVPSSMATAFAWRLGFYIVLDILILMHYPSRIKTTWAALTHNVSTRYKIPIWGYLILPLSVIALEIMGVIPKLIFGLITNPTEVIDGIKSYLNF